MIKFPKYLETDERWIEAMCDMATACAMYNTPDIDQKAELKEIFYRTIIQESLPEVMDYTLRQIKNAIDEKVDLLYKQENFNPNHQEFQMLGSALGKAINGDQL